MKLFFYPISLQCRRPWMVCLFPHSWALLGEVELQLYGVKNKKSCARVSRVAFTVGPSSQDPTPQQITTETALGGSAWGKLPNTLKGWLVQKHKTSNVERHNLFWDVVEQSLALVLCPWSFEFSITLIKLPSIIISKYKIGTFTWPREKG